MKKIIDFLEENGAVDAGNKKIVAYGIKRLIGCVGDFALVIAVAGLLHIVWAGLLFQISYMLLRVHAGGYHASSEKKCAYLSFLCTLLCIGLIRYADMGDGILLCVSFLCGAGIYRDAPVESVNKPLHGNEEAVFRRRTRMVTAAALLGCVLFYRWHYAYFLRAVTIAEAVVFLGMEIVVIPQKYRKYIRQKKSLFYSRGQCGK